MPKVVIDTNLFVRGLLKGPVTMPLMQAWKEHRFKLVTSERLMAELFEVLARPKLSGKYAIQIMGVSEFLAVLASIR